MRLRCAPFSNRLGEVWDTDPEMQGYFTGSHFYMIGQREELTFTHIQYHRLGITFSINSKKRSIHNILLPMGQFEHSDGFEISYYETPQIIRIHSRTPDGPKLVNWFTPDRLIHYYQRGEVRLDNFDNYRELWKFQVHYVGIATRQDSFDRLFRGAHRKRCKILGIEPTANRDSHISDELVILIFDFEEMRMTTFGKLDPDWDFSKVLNDSLLAETEISAEAERVFVNFMKTKYNEVRFTSYPKQQTPAFKEKQFEICSFYIDENITLISNGVEFKGSHNPHLYFAVSPQPDVIAISDGGLSISKADQDVRS